jgi:hypothetical protein
VLSGQTAELAVLLGVRPAVRFIGSLSRLEVPWAMALTIRCDAGQSLVAVLGVGDAFEAGRVASGETLVPFALGVRRLTQVGDGVVRLVAVQVIDLARERGGPDSIDIRPRQPMGLIGLSLDLDDAIAVLTQATCSTSLAASPSSCLPSEVTCLGIIV